MLKVVMKSYVICWMSLCCVLLGNDNTKMIATNDTQENNIRHLGIVYKGLIRIVSNSTMVCYYDWCCCGVECHIFVFVFGVFLCFSLLNDECHYADCQYVECHYSDCHCTECHYVGCRYAKCRGTRRRCRLLLV